jgi:hypothetical protein
METPQKKAPRSDQRAGARHPRADSREAAWAGSSAALGSSARRWPRSSGLMDSSNKGPDVTNPARKPGREPWWPKWLVDRIGIDHSGDQEPETVGPCEYGRNRRQWGMSCSACCPAWWYSAKTARTAWRGELAACVLSGPAEFFAQRRSLVGTPARPRRRCRIKPPRGRSRAFR